MSELFPAKTIAMEVEVCTDEARMAEFNRWMDKVNIPFLKQIEGVVSVHRYRETMMDFDEFSAMWVTPKGQPVRYITMYRINALDPWAVTQKIQKTNEERVAQGKFLDCAKITELTLWDFNAMRKRIQPLLRPETHLPDGMPEMLLLVPTPVPAQGGSILQDDWWLWTHSHDLMEIPGYVQCSRYHNANPKPAADDSPILNVYEIDSDEPRNIPLMKNFVEDRAVRRAQGRFLPAGGGMTSIKTQLRGVFEHWDLM